MFVCFVLGFRVYVTLLHFIYKRFTTAISIEGTNNEHNFLNKSCQMENKCKFTPKGVAAQLRATLSVSTRGIKYVY